MRESKLELSNSSRNRSLDILRGIAAFLVLCRHSPIDSSQAESAAAAERMFGFLQTAGWIGVDLFFVLSGFLIGGLLFSELDQSGSIQLKRFWLRRGFKIWPSYFAAYGLVLILRCTWATVRGDHAGLQKLLIDAIYNSLFIQNYSSCEPWPHSWTLAVEEHFYISLPLLLLAVNSISRWFGVNRVGRLFVMVWGILAISILSWRIGNILSGSGWHLNYYRSHLRADSLLFGVLIALLFRQSRLPETFARRMLSIAVPLTLAAVTIVNIFPLQHIFTTTIGFSILYLWGGILVIVAAHFPRLGYEGPKVLQCVARFMAWIGIYSYTIYLAHSVLFMIPGVATGHDLLIHSLLNAGVNSNFMPWLSRFAFFGLSILGGVLLSHAVERPILQLRSRWVP